MNYVGTVKFYEIGGGYHEKSNGNYSAPYGG